MSRIILYHYERSVFSHRILWYLKLRELAYSQCIQPAVMPRPDLAALDIGYRRIPIMSIGKDVFCDSRAILKVLEDRFPLGDKTPFEAGLQYLFQVWTNASGTSSIFANAVGLLPSRHPDNADPVFQADRGKLAGIKWTSEMLDARRPHSMAFMVHAFQMLETTFLSDGRQWVAGGDNPTAADIEAIFPFQWLVTAPVMEGTLTNPSPGTFITEERFPKTYAWIHRFKNSVKGAGSRAEETLTGSEAASMILSGGLAESKGVVRDPLGFAEGDRLRVRNAEQAEINWDTGKLVELTVDGVCIENERGVRLHFPRMGYAIEKLDA